MPVDGSTPILVVDSRRTTLRLVKDILAQLEFDNVETTVDAAKALDILGKAGPRLVIADLHMEPTSGLQLLRSIRSNDKLKRCPFIMAMNNLAPAEAIAAKHAGADGFVLKPFTPHALRTKIETVLSRQPDARNLPERPWAPSLSASLGRRITRRWG
jgi:two-component system chemotaxis response regulator CheY